MAQAQINFDLPVTSLSDMQGTSDPDLSLTPANPGQGRKRKSTVSHSVAGADLRRRRIHRADCRNNLPSLTLSPRSFDEIFPGQIDRNEYFVYYGHPKFLTLEQGEFVLERKLKDLDFVVSPSQPETPRDGSCLFHALLDQCSYIPDLRGLASNPNCGFVS